MLLRIARLPFLLLSIFHCVYVDPCVCVCVCVCISHLYPFIHLWMDNASFHILAIVNNAAMDTRAHILFQVVLNFLWMDT